MTNKVTMIEYTISPASKLIATMQLRYPRFIHAEFMTHRMLSRNASSSRAIPVAKLIEDIRRDPVNPSYWGKNQPGMQADKEMDESERFMAQHMWNNARDSALMAAENMITLGVHKQIANRVLEPFSHINVVVTATEWDNFFDLRIHKDAQPEIRVLAEEMANCLATHEPIERDHHIPYVVQDERNELPLDVCEMLSAARCARTSYLTHEGKEPDFKADMNLTDKLLQSPIHASPFEHQARALQDPASPAYNLRGWYSQRYRLEMLTHQKVPS